MPDFNLFFQLPFYFVVGSTRREGGVPAYVNLSASSMLMIAMQYTSNPGRGRHHWSFCKTHALVDRPAQKVDFIIDHSVKHMH